MPWLDVPITSTINPIRHHGMAGDIEPTGHPPQAAPRILITAGPTHEPIDAVRFLGNRSSGRMGIALAEASARAGAKTTLLLGPTHLTPASDSGLTLERFRSTSELAERLQAHWPSHDILFMCAAVADYRPRASDEANKIRREAQDLTLELEPTPDLLADLAATSRPDQIRVGWALEPEASLISSAEAKLIRKGVDAIVANPLETIDSDVVRAQIVCADGRHLTPPGEEMNKNAFANWLLETVLSLRGRPETTS